MTEEPPKFKPDLVLLPWVLERLGIMEDPNLENQHPEREGDVQENISTLCLVNKQFYLVIAPYLHSILTLRAKVQGTSTTPWTRGRSDVSISDVMQTGNRWWTHTRSFKLTCDASILGQAERPAAIARCISHPDLATIVKLLREAPKLERIELNLEQMDRFDDSLTPWKSFGSVKRDLENLLLAWQKKETSPKLVIRSIRSFPFRTIRHLSSLFLDSCHLAHGRRTPPKNNLSLEVLRVYKTPSAFHLLAASNDIVVTIKELHIAVSQAGGKHLTEIFSLLKRISEHVKTISFIFTSFPESQSLRPLFPDSEIPEFPALRHLRLEVPSNHLGRCASPILHKFQNHPKLNQLDLILVGVGWPHITWVHANFKASLKGPTWNFFNRLSSSLMVFPTLKKISFYLAFTEEEPGEPHPSWATFRKELHRSRPEIELHFRTYPAERM